MSSRETLALGWQWLEMPAVVSLLVMKHDDVGTVHGLTSIHWAVFFDSTDGCVCTIYRLSTESCLHKLYCLLRMASWSRQCVLLPHVSGPVESWYR